LSQQLPVMHDLTPSEKQQSWPDSQSPSPQQAPMPQKLPADPPSQQGPWAQSSSAQHCWQVPSAQQTSSSTHGGSQAIVHVPAA
jgi:hypothetical protein